jgi:ribosomal protein L37E
MTEFPFIDMRAIYPSEIKTMDPKQVLHNLYYLILKTANSVFIPGYTLDDKMQELSITVLLCRDKYRPDDSSESGFINYTVNSMKNRLYHLREYGYKQTYSISGFKCNACGKQASFVNKRQKCPKCGKTSWSTLREKSVASMEAVMEANSDWDPKVEDTYFFDEEPTISYLLSILPSVECNELNSFLDEDLRLSRRLKRIIHRHIVSELLY